VSDGQMIKAYRNIFGDEGVQSIITTPDNRWLFASNTNEGRLKQISLESQDLVRDYGKIHKKEITCLQTTRDSKWLITGSWDMQVKKISVENSQVDTNFVHVGDFPIMSMKITADGQKLFVGDSKGHLNLISSIDGNLIKDFRKVHDEKISGIMITVEQ
jgi:WD40 repeat protein